MDLSIGEGISVLMGLIDRSKEGGNGDEEDEHERGVTVAGYEG